MNRQDFLISFLAPLLCLKMYLNGNDLGVYVLVVIGPFYALVALFKQIEIDVLKKGCDIAGKKFSEKYKHLNKYL